MAGLAAPVFLVGDKCINDQNGYVVAQTAMIVAWYLQGDTLTGSVSTILLDFDRGGMASSEIDCTNSLVTRTESAKEPLGFRDETTVERPPHISCFFIADRSADPTRRSPAAGVPAF